MSNFSGLGTFSRLEDDELTASLNAAECETHVELANDVDNIRNNNYASRDATVDRFFPKPNLTENENETDADETSPLLGVLKQKPSPCDSCFGFLRNITVEPWLFMVMFAYFLQAVVMKNLIIEKVCIFTFGVNNTDCMNSTNATTENYVQVRASNIEMYFSVVDTVPSVFFSILLGAFSDRYSRKLPMLIPVIGYTISSIGVGVCAYFMEEIPPEFLLLTGIPKGFSGGIIASMVAALSYISDLSAPDKRTLRVAVVVGVFMLGQPIGTLTGSYLCRYSYVLVFLVSSLSFAVSAIYIVLFIEDPESQRTAKTEEKSFCRKFFSLESYKETMATFFKRRDGNARFYIWMLLGVITLILIPDIGQSAVLYLYLRLKFHWNLETYSYFSSVSSVSTSLGLFFTSLILVKMLKLDDMVLAVIGILGAMAVSLSFSFINSSSMIYLVCVPLLLCGVTSLPVRATISKLVPRDEQGKVFSVLGSFEAVTPFLSSLIYTQVYNATEATFPEAIFLMSASIFIIPLIIIIIVALDMRREHHALL